MEINGFSFSTNWKYFNNLGKGCPKEHLCKIIFKSGQYFWTRRFFKIWQFSPFLMPQQPKFYLQLNLWTTLKEDHLRTIPLKLFWNLSIGLVGEVICRKLLTNGQTTTTDGEWSQKLTLHFVLRWAKKTRHVY